MKITEMHVTPIAITDPPLLNAAGLHAPYALRTIIEIVTDDNIYGLGEVPGSVATTKALKAAPRWLIGQRPLPTQRHHRAACSTLAQTAQSRRHRAVGQAADRPCL